MHPISAVIVVKNNPPHLFETLKSIEGFVHEIIIADIGIDQQLIQKLSVLPNVKIEKCDDVLYVELIREILKNKAKQPYVLFLDPDESITPKLKTILSSSLDMYDFFSVPRKNIIFGRWITHSRWWPDYQIRLFKKNAVVWPREIHKQPHTKGREMKLEAKEEYAILHYNYKSIDEYMEKAARYAKSEAAGYISSHKPYTLLSAFQNATSEFVSRYFAHDGYKDGLHGLALALLQTFYSFLVFFYYWEMNKYKDGLSQKELIDYPVSFFANIHKEVLFWKDKKTTSTIKEKIVRKLID